LTEPAPLGVLELTSRGAGFLRRAESGYLPAPTDIHVPERLLRSARLRAGDEIAGKTAPGGRGRSASLTTVDLVNGRDPASLGHRPDFSRLGAVHPNEMLPLECGIQRRGQPDFTNRVIDLLCPFGKGQRALIVAPAKAGKTTVLQNIASSFCSWTSGRKRCSRWRPQDSAR
jgi:transcription termination factor Rho